MFELFPGCIVRVMTATNVMLGNTMDVCVDHVEAILFPLALDCVPRAKKASYWGILGALEGFKRRPGPTAELILCCIFSVCPS